MKGKSTKTALLMSFTSLLLCAAMLIGTTFAWFTDSVTSGVNKIVAGNLDVELYHKSKNVSEEKVTSETANLFKDITLWEPGAYSYETFTVKNEGTLALKYKMALNVAAFTSYNGHNLTEVLKVKTVDTAPTSRPAYTDGVALKDWSLDSANVKLEAGQSKTFTVVLYWEPTANDNDFNMNNGRPQPLSVDLGVTLLATQVEHEFDSFNNQYDHDADSTLPEAAKVESAMAAATAVAGQKTTFTASIAPAKSTAADTTKVEIDEDALTAGEYNLNVKTTDLPNSVNFTPEGTFTVVAASGVTTASEAKVATIKLNLVDENGNPAFTAAADGKKAKITTKIAAGLTNVGVGYSGTATDTVISDVTYNDETGELSFCTNHFSDYYAVGDGAAYNVNTCATYGTLQAAVDALTADNTVMLLKNVDETIIVDAGKSLTLDLNGKTLNGGTTASTPAIKNNGTMIIKNGTVKREDTISSGNWYYVIQNYGTMTFEKGSVVTNDSGVINCSSGASLIRNYGTMNVNDGKFTQERYQVFRSGVTDKDENNKEHRIDGAVLNFKNGYIDGAYCFQNYAELNISGGDIHGTLVVSNADIGATSTTNITGGYFSHPSTSENGGTYNLTGGYVKSLSPAPGYHLSYADVDEDGYYPVVSGAVKNISTQVSLTDTKQASFATIADALAYQKSVGTFGQKVVQVNDSVTETVTSGEGTPFITFGGIETGTANITVVFKKGDSLKLSQTRLTNLLETNEYIEIDNAPRENTSYPGYPHYYFNGITITAKEDITITFTSQNISGTYASGKAFSATLYTATIAPYPAN